MDDDIVEFALDESQVSASMTALDPRLSIQNFKSAVG